jgi:dTDP-4-amino-4,6-dideoxygalactose transaminase
VFVDCDPETYCIDLKQAERAINKNTCAILGVHIFGNPADVEGLEALTKKYNLKLFFDAAHGFGSQYQGKNLGRFGNAEVFSLSPTKLLTAGEGGIVATNDDELAKQLRIGRNYGDCGDYDSIFSGFNARMSEFHAMLGIESLKDLEKNVARRNKIAGIYNAGLSDVPGISLQKIQAGNRSSFKDFTILIDEEEFGMSRDVLYKALTAEKISVKKYFYPPVHEQKAFASYPSDAGTLQMTHRVSYNVLSLPLYSHIDESTVLTIIAAVKNIYEHRQEISAASKELASK